jgi:putative DNA-invertase from lambdoid prophage Rac
MKAAIWARVSTKEQETQNQLAALRQLAAHRGLEVVTEYVSEDSAWTGAHQGILRVAFEAARRGEFQVLLVWALDRLSREGVEMTLAALRTFRESGVQVVSLQEPWAEAGGAVGDLLTSILAWVAQQESARRSERVKAGLDRRRTEGKPVGRQPGARDRRPRKRSGYVKRFEDERRVRKPSFGVRASDEAVLERMVESDTAPVPGLIQPRPPL